MLASELLEAFQHQPKLATAVLWAAARDEATVAEHLVDLGRRSAEERMEHFLLELSARLELVGMGNKAGYDCPLTQYHLGDAMGMTPVHSSSVTDGCARKQSIFLR